MKGTCATANVISYHGTGSRAAVAASLMVLRVLLAGAAASHPETAGER